MDISTLSAKDVLKNEGVKEYKDGMSFFYSELVELNTILYFNEQIVRFPFDLFVNPEDPIFFSIVIKCFRNSTILLVTRLATDQNENLFTLLSFKNKVRDWIRPEFREAFDLRLKTTRFDQTVKNLFDRAKNLRVHSIAHTSKEFVSGNIKLARLNIPELKKLSDALKCILDALSFNVEYMMLPIEYDLKITHPLGTNYKTDIEKILDGIAMDSYILNMAEKNDEGWLHKRATMNEQELNILNKYGCKFNLPEM